MSLLCLLFIGYACCCGVPSSQAGSVGSTCGCRQQEQSGYMVSASVPMCSGSCGCTGFGSNTGVCGDAAYYARQYALCRCCCKN